MLTLSRAQQGRAWHRPSPDKPRKLLLPRGPEAVQGRDEPVPATAVLAVLVVVAVALVVVPFLVPVTNSIWRERGQ